MGIDPTASGRTGVSDADITELDLCRAWTQLPRSIQLVTADGRHVEIVHLGAWTHGLGPDFRGAMICFDGADLQTGSIELHLRSRGWTDHGHHLDPRYNDVVLYSNGIGGLQIQA